MTTDFEQEALEAVAEAFDSLSLTNVTWTQITDAAPNDPAKPWLAGGTTTVDRSVQVIFLPSNRKNLAALQMLTGTEVPDGYLRALMRGDVGFAPTQKDKLTDASGNTYHVDWIDILKPTGLPLLYYMGLKP